MRNSAAVDERKTRMIDDGKCSNVNRRVWAHEVYNAPVKMRHFWEPAEQCHSLGEYSRKNSMFIHFFRRKSYNRNAYLRIIIWINWQRRLHAFAKKIASEYGFRLHGIRGMELALASRDSATILYAQRKTRHH